jgi:uncharacterized membrane protein YvbJ
MFCPQCGEKIPDDAKFCPKCGAALVKTKAAPAPAAPAPAATRERTSGMAVASLVLGILGFIFNLLAILAIIFGAIAISQTNKDPNLRGRGMAIAGLVLGIIGSIGWIIAIIAWSTFWWWI